MASIGPDGGHEIEELRSYTESSTIKYSSLFADKCIFRVPEILRQRNAVAFEPKQFSIGPLHHGELKLEYGEIIKRSFFNELISELESTNNNIYNEIVKEIKGIQKEARECYVTPLGHLSDGKFTRILVLDGCFIIELFHQLAKNVKSEDPAFNVASLLRSLQHDLFLLENQIPWSVLNHLFKIINETRASSTTLVEITFEFCFTIFPGIKFPTIADIGSLKDKHSHLLGLLRTALVYNVQRVTRGNFDGSSQLNLSATDLKGAGIKIEKSSSCGIIVEFVKSSSTGILGGKFSNGVLRIQALLIHKTAVDVVRNLISFEQCYPKCSSEITSYAILLDNLLNTTSDMNILRQNGIIGHWFKSLEEIKFFNELLVDSYVNGFYYEEYCKKLNEHCQGFWPRFRLIYVRHFTNPWGVGLQIAGIVGIIIAVIETFLNFTGVTKD